jgi:hypothetical protein
MRVTEILEGKSQLFPVNSETLRLGSEGNAVKAWQWSLTKTATPNLAIDGKFGDKTKQSTVDFQSKNNITNDGVVGKETYSMGNRELAAKGITSIPFLNGVKPAVQKSYAKTNAGLPNPELAKVVFDFFKQHGFTDEQSAAWVGNFAQESRFKGAAYNPNDSGSPSFGIAQWKLERLVDLKRFSKQQGSSITDIHTQLNFVLHELTTIKRKVLSLLSQQPDSIEHATKVIQQKYEVGANYGPRLRYATAAYNMFAKGTGE